MPGNGHPRTHIGTSGWDYRHWRGPFYPDKLKRAEWLHWYARHFDCVEINSSFYRLPQSETLRSWAEQMPAGFHFAFKGSRLITHMKKLRDCGQAFHTYYSVVAALGRRLGPILFQLPPSWHVNIERLSAFLSLLPRRLPVAFEFRNPSWECEAVYDCLREHNAALCVYHLEGRESPAVVTGDFVYVRLHGPAAAYEGSYHTRTLRKWARRIEHWTADGLSVYVFFNNDQAGYAPRDANRLKHQLGLDTEK